MANCVRCWTPSPATQIIQFCYRDDRYEVQLCDRHAEQFGTDMAGWLSVALPLPETHAPVRYLPGATLRRQVQVVVPPWRDTLPPEPPRPAPVPVPAQRHEFHLRGWQWSNHAHERAQQRGISDDEIYEAVVRPHYTCESDEPGLMLHYRDDVRVVCNPAEKVILTVTRRGNGADDEGEDS